MTTHTPGPRARETKLYILFDRRTGRQLGPRAYTLPRAYETRRQLMQVARERGGPSIAQEVVEYCDIRRYLPAVPSTTEA